MTRRVRSAAAFTLCLAQRERWSPRAVWLLGVFVVVPFVVSAIVLATRTWHPVLDMAMTEFRVRDVGTRETPLIGLPGRIGSFPDQGSHPGPWSFYLIAPIYRLVGASAYGMQLGSLVINTVTAALVLFVVHRRGRPVVTLGAAAVLALAVRGYGLEVLSHPWNPYFPLLLWLLVLLATWSVLEGDRWAVLAVVGAGSVAAQTHVPYLLPCIAMNALAVGVLARRAFADGQPSPARSADRRALGAAVGLGAFMWLPPFVDQLVRDPGNIRMLIEHFTGTTDEEPIGVSGGTTVFFRHLNLPEAFVRLFDGSQTFLDMSGESTGVSIGGVVFFAAWALAAVFAVRMRHRPLINLHAVIAVALAVGWLSMVRIFGKVWFYLTLWAWGTALVAALASVWTVIVWWRARPEPSRQIVDGAAGIVFAVIVVMTVMSVAEASTQGVPQQQISDMLGETLDPTATALEAGVGAAVGRDGSYVVFWQDAVFIGAPGYGMVNELERRGFDVGVHPTWRIPVTTHRAMNPGDYDAEIHLVTGGFIDEWRRRPDHVEVATVDVRTDAERARYDELEASVVDRLAKIGRSEVIPLVAENLFGALIQPDLPSDIVADLEEMLLLFRPVSVFIAPPGSSS